MNMTWFSIPYPKSVLCCLLLYIMKQNLVRINLFSGRTQDLSICQHGECIYAEIWYVEQAWYRAQVRPFVASNLWIDIAWKHSGHQYTFFLDSSIRENCKSYCVWWKKSTLFVNWSPGDLWYLHYRNGSRPQHSIKCIGGSCATSDKQRACFDAIKEHWGLMTVFMHNPIKTATEKLLFQNVIRDICRAKQQKHDFHPLQPFSGHLCMIAPTPLQPVYHFRAQHQSLPVSTTFQSETASRHFHSRKSVKFAWFLSRMAPTKHRNSWTLSEKFSRKGERNDLENTLPHCLHIIIGGDTFHCWWQIGLGCGTSEFWRGWHTWLRAGNTTYLWGTELRLNHCLLQLHSPQYGSRYNHEDSQSKKRNCPAGNCVKQKMHWPGASYLVTLL